MRLAAIIAVALSLPTGLAAQETSHAEADQLCGVFSSLAVQIMRGRQNGVALTDMMQISDEPVVRQMVIVAYEHPMFAGEQAQERAISSFRDETTLMCYQTFGS